MYVKVCVGGSMNEESKVEPTLRLGPLCLSDTG